MVFPRRASRNFSAQTPPPTADSGGTFATPLLAAELRALHDELAVAARDNVALADALESKRRKSRAAKKTLKGVLEPDASGDESPGSDDTDASICVKINH